MRFSSSDPPLELCGGGGGSLCVQVWPCMQCKAVRARLHGDNEQQGTESFQFYRYCIQ